jgi:Na+/H+-dicarboxylate symporter
MGLRAIIYFEIVTTLALLIGLGTVNLMRPGDGMTLPPRKARRRSRPPRKTCSRSCCTWCRRR